MTSLSLRFHGFHGLRNRSDLFVASEDTMNGANPATDRLRAHGVSVTGFFDLIAITS